MGGAPFLHKGDVCFQSLSTVDEAGLEVNTINVKIHNIYLPSSSSQEIRINPALSPFGPDSIIV